MSFSGRPAAFGLVSGHEDDTVYSEAETLREFELMLRSVGQGILYENIFHGSVIESGRAFRPGEHASAGQRSFPSGDADGTGFCPGGIACQSSPGWRQRGFASGPIRATLERAVAKRHLCK